MAENHYEFTITRRLKIVGWLATAMIFVAVVGMVVLWGLVPGSPHPARSIDRDLGLADDFFPAAQVRFPDLA